MSNYKKYKPEDIARLRLVPIPEVLRDLGYSIKRTRGGLFYSPFKKENTPSFEVCLDPGKPEYNLWHDWSSGGMNTRATGDVIHLVQELQGLEFNKALDYLADRFAPGLVYTPRAEDIIDVLPGETVSFGSSKISILKVQDKIYSTILSNYATGERHIPMSIVNRYCDQVNYVCVDAAGKATPERWAIGFPNISGGYALRSGLKKKGKISTGSDISVINGDGYLSQDLKTQNLCIFEGFFNALTLLAANDSVVPRGTDILVLNSTSNTRKAIDWILSKNVTKTVMCFLDNDDTGSTHTRLIAEALSAAGMRVLDMRHTYKNYNDLNERWVAEHQKESAAKDLGLTRKSPEASQVQEKKKTWVATPRFK